MLESGQIQRFDHAGQYTSYYRPVPANRISNGKKKGAGNRKCDTRYLTWTWIEAANTAIRFPDGKAAVGLRIARARPPGLSLRPKLPTSLSVGLTW